AARMPGRRCVGTARGTRSVRATMIPYAVARPLLFALDAETAHEITLRALDGVGRLGGIGVLAGCPVEDPVEVMGLRFRNRVGLAAGLDKNAAHVDALAALGFG